MKTFVTIPVILLCYTSIAQKNYEPTDTRRKTESFARMPKNEIRNDLATFSFSGIDESVGKEPLRKVAFTAFDANQMTFEGEGVKAKVTTAPFDAAKHKLDYDEKYVIKVDKKPYYGDYGNVPKKYISSLSLIVDKDTIIIPPAAYSDLFNLNLTYMDKGVQRSTNAIYFSKDGHRIYFYLFCKDNTGSYEVTFVIQDKHFLRRVLDYGFM